MSKAYTVLFAIGYIFAIGLMVLGAIFVMAAPANLNTFIFNMATGLIMVVAGVVIIVGLRLRQRVVVEAKVTLKPTQMKEFKCKNCSAPLSDKDYTIAKNGSVIVKCTYCGALYELADNPVW
ncbi:MAG: hypothetical protein GYA24_20000 [Candidatus Lokiarchaeota archaeon]|nr:hypothetical protein [Candidatus Lokiarchaeota archaeon]